MVTTNRNLTEHMEGMSSISTILHEALKLNAHRCLQYLIDCRISDRQLDEPDEHGMTVLHLAAERCSVENNVKMGETLEALLDCGAYVNCRDNEGDTPLCKMLRSKNPNLIYVKLLLMRKDIDVEALCRQSESPSDLVPKLSFSTWEDYKNVHNSIGYEATTNFLLSKLYEAIILSDKIEVVRLYQKIYSRDPNSLMDRHIGVQPLLHHLVQYLEVDHILDLLNAGADPWVINKVTGAFALHAALARGHLPIVHSLIEKMKQTSSANILNLSKHTFSLLQKVICNYKLTSNAQDLNYERCLKRILEQDILLNYDAVNEMYGFLTPLTLAQLVEFKKGVKLLKDHGYSENIESSLSENSLPKSEYYIHLNKVKYFFSEIV